MAWVRGVWSGLVVLGGVIAYAVAFVAPLTGTTAAVQAGFGAIATPFLGPVTVLDPALAAATALARRTQPESCGELRWAVAALAISIGGLRRQLDHQGGVSSATEPSFVLPSLNRRARAAERHRALVNRHDGAVARYNRLALHFNNRCVED